MCAHHHQVTQHQPLFAHPSPKADTHTAYFTKFLSIHDFVITVVVYSLSLVSPLWPYGPIRPLEPTRPLSVRRLPQARTLECIAISFSRDAPHPGIEPRILLSLLYWQAASSPLSHQGSMKYYIKDRMIMPTIAKSQKHVPQKVVETPLGSVQTAKPLLPEAYSLYHHFIEFICKVLCKTPTRLTTLLSSKIAQISSAVKPFLNSNLLAKLVTFFPVNFLYTPL